MERCIFASCSTLSGFWNFCFSRVFMHFAPISWWLISKESTCNARASRFVGLIPGLGQYPGRGHGNPLQCSCLGNHRQESGGLHSMGLQKNWTRLKQLSMLTVCSRKWDCSLLKEVFFFFFWVGPGERTGIVPWICSVYLWLSDWIKKDWHNVLLSELEFFFLFSVEV